MPPPIQNHTLVDRRQKYRMNLYVGIQGPVPVQRLVMCVIHSWSLYNTHGLDIQECLLRNNCPTEDPELYLFPGMVSKLSSAFTSHA